MGRIRFSDRLEDAVRAAELIFLAVGTPMRRGDGYADLSFVFQAVESLRRISPSSPQSRRCRWGPAARLSAACAR